MIKKVYFTEPERYNCDEMGEPVRIYNNEDHLRLNLFIETEINTYTLSIYNQNSYYDLEEKGCEDVEYYNMPIENYFAICEKKEMSKLDLEKITMYLIFLEDSLEFVNSEMRNKIVNFEHNYKLESNYDENGDVINLGLEEYLENFTDEEYEELIEQWKQDELDEIILPFQYKRKKIKFCIKISEKYINIKNNEKENFKNNLEDRFNQYGL
tara:strand:+ start:3342 stop:3974 length:633 start_codon:yes stop_codon:yes gene_type:complete